MKGLMALGFVALVAADLPNHCLRSNVQGKWMLLKGQPTHTKDNAHINCAQGNVRFLKLGI